LQFLDSSLRKISKDFILFFFVDRATKLIAAIRQCEIIVRDANRIHHFHKNGDVHATTTFRKKNVFYKSFLDFVVGIVFFL
jgi:hypothetical protein